MRKRNQIIYIILTFLFVGFIYLLLYKSSLIVEGNHTYYEIGTPRKEVLIRTICKSNENAYIIKGDTCEYCGQEIKSSDYYKARFKEKDNLMKKILMWLVFIVILISEYMIFRPKRRKGVRKWVIDR